MREKTGEEQILKSRKNEKAKYNGGKADKKRNSCKGDTK